MVRTSVPVKQMHSECVPKRMGCHRLAKAGKLMCLRAREFDGVSRDPRNRSWLMRCPRRIEGRAICRNSARIVRLAGDMRPECGTRDCEPSCHRSCVVEGLSWQNSFARWTVLQAPLHAVAKEFVRN